MISLLLWLIFAQNWLISSSFWLITQNGWLISFKIVASMQASGALEPRSRPPHRRLVDFRLKLVDFSSALVDSCTKLVDFLLCLVDNSKRLVDFIQNRRFAASLRSARSPFQTATTEFG
ncbi:hypothetical protein [Bacillus massilinigeriensis]|uniref:hypothetical protein n=1 Tax=Bacillus mediterraneensis TaxID=1805474 RepID=UPI00114D46CE|nr:hypothetical protein [Bacillus mediterraneensis]